MANIIDLTDFKGAYSIAVNSDSNYELMITDVIEENESTILVDLLGSALYAELLDSTLAGGSTTPTPELIKIFDPFIENINGCEVKSDGIKVMLARMIYVNINEAQAIKNTVSGDRSTTAETSTDAVIGQKALINYNRGINTYNAIQNYICHNRQDYQTFNGKNRDISLVLF